MKEQGIEGIKKYCDLLEELKLRIKTVQSIVNHKVSLSAFGHAYFADEFIFLQIRKILEIIAFGSMASNIALYKATYQDYSGHWRAKKILEKLEKINKDFYPLPLQISDEKTQGADHVLENVKTGFLTRDDFVFLYDACSQVIHSPNPYGEASKIDLKMSVDDWMHRIASLLWFHQIKLANSQILWFVYLMHPETGKAHAIQAQSLR